MRFFAIVSFLVILPSSFVLAGQMESINVVLLNKIQPYEKRVSYSQTGFSKSRRADFPKTEYVKIWQELMGSFRYDCYIHPKPIQYLMVETDETVPDTVGSMTFAYDPTYGYTGFTIVEDGYSAEAVITYNQNGQISKILIVTLAEEDPSKYLDTITFDFTSEGAEHLISTIGYKQYG